MNQWNDGSFKCFFPTYLWHWQLNQNAEIHFVQCSRSEHISKKFIIQKSDAHDQEKITSQTKNQHNLPLCICTIKVDQKEEEDSTVYSSSKMFVH